MYFASGFLGLTVTDRRPTTTSNILAYNTVAQYASQNWCTKDLLALWPCHAAPLCD